MLPYPSCPPCTETAQNRDLLSLAKPACPIRRDVSWTEQAYEIIADKSTWLPCLYWSVFLDSRKTSMEAPSEDWVMRPALMCARSSNLVKPQKPRLMAAARDKVRSRPDVRQARTLQASSILSKGMGSFRLSPDGMARLACCLMAGTMGAPVTSKLGCKAVECSDCSRGQIDRAEGVCCLRQHQQVQHNATVSGAAGRNDRSWPAHHFLKYPQAGAYLLIVQALLHQPSEWA